MKIIADVGGRNIRTMSLVNFKLTRHLPYITVGLNSLRDIVNVNEIIKFN